MIFWRIISAIATFGMLIYGVFAGTNFNDYTSQYKKNVEAVAYENDFDSAIPQTEIYKMIDSHFKSGGTKEKKVIVIGYDGCRADVVSLYKANEKSAVKALLADGGHLKLSYCGGVNYPVINTQKTSTAPGWCSMLTGEWATVTGITDNGIVKSNDYLTLLTTEVESKTIDSSAFYVSWNGHFIGDDNTYSLERKYVEDKKLNVSMVDADDDAGTYANVMADINSAECSDFIFSIFEYCDHYGHDTGFSINNPDQVKGFAEQESDALDIINAIKARENYANEDWLIILTSDHGGYNTGHGGPTMQERYTFICANKDF